MLYCLVCVLLFIIIPFGNLKASSVIAATQQNSQANDSLVMEFYGKGVHATTPNILTPTQLNDWFNLQQAVNIYIIGNIILGTDKVKFNPEFANRLNISNIVTGYTVGDFLTGNNVKIYNLDQLSIDSIGTSTLKGLYFYELRNLKLSPTTFEHLLQDIHFYNTKDLNAIIQGTEVKINSVSFEMDQNSTLHLLFNDINTITNYHLHGLPMTIVGAQETAQANIIFNTSLYEIIELNTDITSNLKTNLRIENTNLQGSGKISINNGSYANTNTVNIVNSTVKVNKIDIQGGTRDQLYITDSFLSTHLSYGSSFGQSIINNSILEGAKFDTYGIRNSHRLENGTIVQPTSEIRINDDNSHLIADKAEVKGKIQFHAQNYTFIASDSVFDKAAIVSSTNTMAKFEFKNSTFNGTIFRLRGEHQIKFDHSPSNNWFLFEPNSSYDLFFLNFDKDTTLDGGFDINETSTVNIWVKDASTIRFNPVVKGTINNIYFAPDSKIIIDQHPLVAKCIEYKGDSEIILNLGIQPEAYIKGSKVVFPHDAVTKISPLEADSVPAFEKTAKDINLISASSIIVTPRHFLLSDELTHYKLVVDIGKVVLTLKKADDFVDLFKSYDLHQTSLYSKHNLLGLVDYLDRLWVEKVNTHTLDTIIEVAYDPPTFYRMLDQVLPVSNDILFQHTSAALSNFVQQLPRVDDMSNIRSNTWNTAYYGNLLFTLRGSNHANMEVNTKGFAAGIQRELTNKVIVGISAGLSINKNNKYTYDVNALHYNTAFYTKFNFFKSLYSTTALAVSWNHFDITRLIRSYRVYFEKMQSKPKGMGYLMKSTLGYNFPIITSKHYRYSVVPQVGLNINRIQVSSYTEEGRNVLSVQKFDTLTYKVEGGIASSLTINMTHNNLDILLGVNTGYDNNHLPHTTFWFQGIPGITAQLKHPTHQHTHINTYMHLLYTHTTEKYGLDLRIGHTRSILSKDTSLSLSGYIRFN